MTAKFAIVPQPISTASPYEVEVTITWPGATISVVKATILSGEGDTVGNTLITNIITLGLVSGTPDTGALYRGVIPANQTIKLLSDTTDTASAIAFTRPLLVLVAEGTNAAGNALEPVKYPRSLRVNRNVTASPVNPGPGVYPIVATDFTSTLFAAENADEFLGSLNETLQAIASLPPTANRNIGFDASRDVALRADGAGSALAIVADSEPPTGDDGQLWYNFSTNILRVRYDGNWDDQTLDDGQY
ncbi:MAG: hypothetical protein AAF810_05390 [Cyanobacteria bacterium P01_D01_bin.36]